jgi:hypothetical protein
MPPSTGVSSLEPILTHTPIEEDSTSVISSVMTFIPLERTDFWIRLIDYK